MQKMYYVMYYGEVFYQDETLEQAIKEIATSLTLIDEISGLALYEKDMFSIIEVVRVMNWEGKEVDF